MARLKLDPTFAGGFSVLVWGCAIPIAESVEDRIGLITFLGFASCSNDRNCSGRRIREYLSLIRHPKFPVLQIHIGAPRFLKFQYSPC